MSAPTETRTCEHGIVLRQGGFAAQYAAHGSFAWNGPIGECRCCFSRYGYIDSGGTTVDIWGHIRIVSTINDRDLCKPCGGQERHYDSGAA